MDQLGPFEACPVVAVAVSGGADSLAAALLTRDWARAQGGEVLALVVDHGLRTGSADEVRVTGCRLAAAGIAFVGLSVSLSAGPGIAARARAARHSCLEAACAERGILHLVFGQHAFDQAETVIMRMLSGSGRAGLAGMAALVETACVRKLRPLLYVAPGVLQDLLRDAGIGWVSDPSNDDPAALRARLRRLRSGRDAGGLLAASQARGRVRAVQESEAARVLAERVAIFPQGFAQLSNGPIMGEALAALVGMISGAARPPSVSRVADLAACVRPATIGGVRVLPAGRLGAGWLLVRETSAVAAPVAAQDGVVWDGRFRLHGDPGADVTLGAWGSDAPRDRAGLPSVVMQAMPVLRCAGAVIATWSDLHKTDGLHISWQPRLVAASAAFFPLPLFV